MQGKLSKMIEYIRYQYNLISIIQYTLQSRHVCRGVVVRIAVQYTRFLASRKRWALVSGISVLLPIVS